MKQKTFTKKKQEEAYKFAVQTLKVARSLRIKEVDKDTHQQHEVCDVHILFQEIVTSNNVGDELQVGLHTINIGEQGCVLSLHPSATITEQHSIAVVFSMTYEYNTDSYRMRVFPTPHMLEVEGRAMSAAVEGIICLFYTYSELLKAYKGYQDAEKVIKTIMDKLPQSIMGEDEYWDTKWAYGINRAITITSGSSSKLWTPPLYHVEGDEHGHIAWWGKDGK